MEKWAIIVAGGKGLRMGTSTPKQFLEIDSKPIIARTIERFLEFDININLIVVVPEDQKPTWLKIKESHFKDQKINLAIGGSTRFESVKSGLAQIEANGLVAIHDAVRPYVSGETIEKSFLSAQQFGSGVAAVALKDSIRKIEDGHSEARDRSTYRLVQTPQTFRIAEIKTAYAAVTGADFQDDAAVYEAAGFKVKLVEGSYENIKITTPDDLK